MVSMRLMAACLVTAAVTMAAAAGACAGEPPPLVAGEAVAGRAGASGERRLFDPRAASGDYIRGRLDVGSGRFDLDLVDAAGRHLRRLADNAGGAAEFQFVAGHPGEKLSLTAREASGDYRLTLESRIGPEAQRAPPPSWLSPAIADAAASLARGETSDAFWSKVAEQGAPLIEPGAEGKAIVTFLGRGAKRNIRLFGAPSGDHEELQRLGTSDIWFRSFEVPAQTRLSYQLAFDVPDLPGSARERRVAILATAKADPLNRHRWPAEAIDAYNQDSVLELPGAPPQPFVAASGNPQGALARFTMASRILGNSREITIYRPPGFDPAREDNVLLFVFDAEQYLERVALPRILDNMIAAGAVPPVVAVFIANPDREARARELPGNPGFADFMAGELYPRVLAETGLAPSAERTVLAGSSYGGLAATTVALRHPQVFGAVLSMSGSFWWSPPGTPEDRREYVAGLVADMPAPPLRFFLSAGVFETGAGGTAGIVDTTRHLRDVLTARGVPVTYRDYAGGHDYLVWQGAISDGLIALFPRSGP